MALTVLTFAAVISCGAAVYLVGVAGPVPESRAVSGARTAVLSAAVLCVALIAVAVLAG